jgi:hypothetical protein
MEGKEICKRAKLTPKLKISLRVLYLSALGPERGKSGVPFRPRIRKGADVLHRSRNRAPYNSQR